MNVSKYLKSRLGQTLEKMKVAYLSGKHLIFLVSNETSFVRELIESASILPCIKEKKENGAIVVYSNVEFTKDAYFIVREVGNLTTSEQPKLFVYFSDNTKSDQNRLGMDIPYASLMNYVNICNGLLPVNKECKLGIRKRIANLQQSMIWVVVDSLPSIPVELEPYSEIITVPFMGELEFKEYVSSLISEQDGLELTERVGGYRLIEDDTYLTTLFNRMRGLNATQVEMVLRKNKILLGKLYFNPDKETEDMDKLLTNIRKESEHIISSSAALKLMEAEDNAPAGWGNVAKWIAEHKKMVSSPEDFKRYIQKPLGGALVAGVPGSGKSMMAKYIAHEFRLPLIRMDLGDVLGKYVGDSEKNMNKALSLIEALSPCVLWIDEMEKAFAGSSGESHETTKRALGKFLTWMQEKGDKGLSCFVFATANDISAMPPEMFRSGRFDAKFYTFLPSAKECAEIFASHIKGQCIAHKFMVHVENAKYLFEPSAIENPTHYEEMMLRILESPLCIKDELSEKDERVSRKNKFFTGADIEQLIVKAKTIYLNKYGMVASFQSNKFEECLKRAFTDLKTYGETNLEDVAFCFSLLATNNFTAVSDSDIVPFEGYNELAMYVKGGEKIPKLYVLDDEDEHIKNLGKYDKQLYLTVRNTLNLLSDVIIKKKRRR